MSKIGPKDTTPELFIRKLIYRLGFRFRLHRRSLPGKPDLVFPKYKRVIFINGCFWHGHNKCKRAKMPSTNKDFWKEKIKNNKSNDIKAYRKLKFLNWEYLVLWQCEIKNKNKEILINKILKFLNTKNIQQ